MEPWTSVSDAFLPTWRSAVWWCWEDFWRQQQPPGEGREGSLCESLELAEKSSKFSAHFFFCILPSCNGNIANSIPLSILCWTVFLSSLFVPRGNHTSCWSSFLSVLVSGKLTPNSERTLATRVAHRRYWMNSARGHPAYTRSFPFHSVFRRLPHSPALHPSRPLWEADPQRLHQRSLPVRFQWVWSMGSHSQLQGGRRGRGQGTCPWFPHLPLLPPLPPTITWCLGLTLPFRQRPSSRPPL